MVPIGIGRYTHPDNSFRAVTYSHRRLPDEYSYHRNPDTFHKTNTGRNQTELLCEIGLEIALPENSLMAPSISVYSRLKSLLTKILAQKMPVRANRHLFVQGHVLWNLRRPQAVQQLIPTSDESST
jgi:hypothetical protein